MNGALQSDWPELPLCPSLPLPPGCSPADVTALFESCSLEGAPPEEMRNYWQEDWRRFVYTFGMASSLTGPCLEIGSNPYFTTTLLRLFTSLDLTLANYFGPHFPDKAAQSLTLRHPQSGTLETLSMEFRHFNIEEAAFPFPDNSFDVVLFCEVLEHLQMDPLRVLLEVKRVLRPEGHLILTTPNVSRLENVCRMIAGANLYDPYSGYGPYGRHNREYNKHELARLLEFCGFEVEVLFSADVHDNGSNNYYPVAEIVPLLERRKADLGQYLFSRSRNVRQAQPGRPAWLFRSYPAGELVQ